MYWQDHVKRQVLPMLCCTHFDLAIQIFQFITFHLQLNSHTSVAVHAECALKACTMSESYYWIHTTAA